MKKSREEIINMSNEEAEAWIREPGISDEEHWKRHKAVHFDCGLTRAGVKLEEPVSSGELILDIE